MSLGPWALPLLSLLSCLFFPCDPEYWMTDGFSRPLPSQQPAANFGQRRPLLDEKSLLGMLKPGLRSWMTTQPPVSSFREWICGQWGWYSSGQVQSTQSRLCCFCGFWTQPGSLRCSAQHRRITSGSWVFGGLPLDCSCWRAYPR